MTLDQLMEEWRKDCAIDTTELGAESVRIPQLHNKYLKFYYDERRKLQSFEFQSKDLFRKKYELYNGKLSEEELKELGWEPFLKRLMKHEIDLYLESDKDLLQKNAKIAMQKEKISYLEEVIKNINQRGWQIRNAIEWARFSNGVS